MIRFCTNTNCTNTNYLNTICTIYMLFVILNILYYTYNYHKYAALETISIYACPSSVVKWIRIYNKF